MYIALMSIHSWQNSRLAEQENIFFISASKKRVRRTMLIDIWMVRIEREVYRVRNSNFSEWVSGIIEVLHCLSAKLSTIVKSLCIARVLRHFVLIPHEICVVPFGHWKIAPDRNDISLANIGSTVVSLTHACASFHSFKHVYLSLQKCSLQQYFIKKLPLPT